MFIDVVYDELEDLRVAVHLDLDDFVSAGFQLCLKVLHVLQDDAALHFECLYDIILRIDDFDLHVNNVL